MKKAAPRKSDVAAVSDSARSDVAVRPGDRFVTKIGRQVFIDEVTWETGQPRLIARELEVACAHPLLRAMNGGRCPTCRAPVPGKFEIALTFRVLQIPELPRWCMPAGYERA